MKLIIFIPAYNEEKTIASVIQRIPRHIPKISEKEIIVVDDGSTDNTAKVAKEAGAEIISHSENRGLGVAFSTGVKEALSRKADIMVTIDADGQFDPREISKLLKPILGERTNVVLGSRFTKG
ncbi:MAG: glycosyltransferase family 2 protein [Candidatus Aminicenantia bacterium]